MSHEYSWYKLSAWNQQDRYGYGTREEAEQMCDILNADREINQYSAEVVDDPEQVAKLEADQEWSNFEDEFAAMAQAE